MTAPTILIVEDSPIQAKLLQRALEEQGYRVAMAKDGAEGLEAARRHRPALIVSDVNMPVMSGFELCHAVRQDETLRGTTVILLTQLTQTRDVLRGLIAGADAYVTKPYDAAFLLARIRALLAQPPQAEPAAERLEVALDGETYAVTAGRRRILDLLISTYENAVRQNLELARTREELRALNEQLEARVRERGAALADQQARTREQAARLAQLESEIQALQRLAAAPEAAAPQAAPLSESAPDAFDALVARYQALLDQAVERQAYKVEHDVRGALHVLARELGARGAGPRDVVELHTRALQMKVATLPAQLKWAYGEEGRLTVLELMGDLAARYREGAPRPG